MTVAELPPLKYGKVVGRFLTNIIDGPDLDDLPDFAPLTGTVSFAAGAPVVLVAGAEPAPATYVQLPEHYECQIDEAGYLTWRGRRGVRLVAPNAETNPSEWTWRVSFDLSYGGRHIPMAPFDFHVPEYVPGPNPADPDADSIGLVDLALVAPVPGSPGNAVVMGPAGQGLRIDRQVAAYSELPADPGEGAQYVVQADGLLYVFHAAAGGWPPSGAGIVIRGAAGSAAWADIVGRPSTFPPTIGTTADTAVAGDDPRLYDARTPTPHVHTTAQLADIGTAGRDLLRAPDVATALAVVGAVATTDPRLSDARTPTAADQAYDLAFKSHTGNRAAGSGNVKPEGIRIERRVSFSSVTYRGETAGTGDLVAEVRRNGELVAGTAATIAPTAQAADTTLTGTWVFEPGDRLSVHISTVDNPAGRGLQVSLKGTTL